jgi:hypothetical protein
VHPVNRERGTGLWGILCESGRWRGDLKWLGLGIGLVALRKSYGYPSKASFYLFRYLIMPLFTHLNLPSPHS